MRVVGQHRAFGGQTFGHPVVIDMFCYRRFGHNEADEPAFTQPLMYRRIAKHPRVVDVYADRLVEEGLPGKVGLFGISRGAGAAILTQGETVYIPRGTLVETTLSAPLIVQ